MTSVPTSSSALTDGDFDGDGRSDLAAAAPTENIVTTDAGAVNVVYGSSFGLTAAGSQFLHQGVLGGTPAAGDQFGFQLG